MRKKLQAFKGETKPKVNYNCRVARYDRNTHPKSVEKDLDRNVNI